MTLAGRKRVTYILDLAKENKPDLLACAGWSLCSIDDLTKLADKSINIGHTTYLVEVHHDSDLFRRGHPLSHLYRKPEDIPSHVIYAINGGHSTRLGTQLFATSGELNSAQGSERLKALENSTESRIFTVGDKTAFALCCGELNVLKGRNSVACRSYTLDSKLRSVDITVNPTHDLMGNGGTLKAKRKHLSIPENGRSKISISISNWNICKLVGSGSKTIKQKQDSETLHTVYFNGDQVKPVGVLRKCGQYEFRKFEVEI